MITCQRLVADTNKRRSPMAEPARRRVLRWHSLRKPWCLGHRNRDYLDADPRRPPQGRQFRKERHYLPRSSALTAVASALRCSGEMGPPPQRNSWKTMLSGASSRSLFPVRTTWLTSSGSRTTGMRERLTASCADFHARLGGTVFTCQWAAAMMLMTLAMFTSMCPRVH